MVSSTQDAPVLIHVRTHYIMIITSISAMLIWWHLLSKSLSSPFFDLLIYQFPFENKHRNIECVK